MAEKKRLDVYLFENSLCDSREKARALIMEGKVYINGQKALKAGDIVKEKDKIEVRGDKIPFVSRGGLKLQKALDTFPIDITDFVCLDVGASTGGFTDCMLQHGARKVYAVDVGYNQLAWKLRSDSKVINLEKTNFRYIDKSLIPEEIDFAGMDVAFISIKLLIPVMREFLKPEGEAVCLIKPQFEAGRENVGKKGVVRDFSVHLEVVENICDFVLENGFDILNLDYSPIKGPEGNIEYLIHIRKSQSPGNYFSGNISEVIEKSHTLNIV